MISKCFHSFSRSEKWNQNASRSRSRSENSREFLTILEKRDFLTDLFRDSQIRLLTQMACSWGNNHEQLNNFPLFSQAPQLGDVFHLGSAPVHHQHQLDNARLRFKLSKRFFQQVGEQLWAAAEGEEEMCLIDGEKYESRAQRNTLKYFFRPEQLLALPLMDKGSPVPR